MLKMCYLGGISKRVLLVDACGQSDLPVSKHSLPAAEGSMGLSFLVAQSGDLETRSGFIIWILIPYTQVKNNCHEDFFIQRTDLQPCAKETESPLHKYKISLTVSDVQGRATSTTWLYDWV